jgi:hypothetical protein
VKETKLVDAVVVLDNDDLLLHGEVLATVPAELKAVANLESYNTHSLIRPSYSLMAT